MNSQRTVRLVIALLGAVAIISIGGVIYLASWDKTIPESLTVALGAAIGAIGGLLSQTNATLPNPAPAEPVILPPEA